jgi:DNA-binding CsgD family transcriptional regulator
MTMTPREHEVASLLERNLSNEEIARKLGITIGTVKSHVHNISIKRGSISRPQRCATTAAG